MTQFGTRRAAGLLAAIAVTALITALIFPVKTIAPPISAGILYLLGVLLVASFWGARLGMFTALLSGLAFTPMRPAPSTKSAGWTCSMCSQPGSTCTRR